MNDTQFEDLITKAGAHAELTPSARVEMRSALSAYVAAHPIAMPSPYIRYFSLTLESLRRPAFALAAFVLIIGGGTAGIASAAEGTLPGDALYPVKVAIVEPLQTALISSPTAQASWKATLAERRITEAATLANEGRLATSTQTTLALAFAKDANAASSTPPTGIFAARLSAYEEVLADIEAKQGSSNTGILRGAIRAQLALDIPIEPPAVAVPMRAAAKTTAPTVMHASFMSVTAPVQDSAASTSGSVAAPQAAPSPEDALAASARLEVLERAAVEFNINPFATSTATSSTWIRAGREHGSRP